MPPRYRLVVAGELGPRYASAFDEMRLHAHEGETDITGPIIDQSHLRGLLDRIASLGLTLRSLRIQLTPDSPTRRFPPFHLLCGL